MGIDMQIFECRIPVKELIPILGSYSITNLIVQAQTVSESIQNDTRATTSNFSVKPLDNWAYENVNYGNHNKSGSPSTNAIEMWPNQFDNKTMVYGLITQDGHYAAKNVKLDQYVKDKVNDTELKYLNESKLLSRDNATIINATTNAVKLTYDNPDNKLKLVLYLLNHNKENYLMFFWAKNNLFNKYSPEFDRMINTVKWLDR